MQFPAQPPEPEEIWPSPSVAAPARRRRGRPATGRRPRLLLTIPPELEAILKELSERFDIPKATILEQQAVIGAIDALAKFAEWSAAHTPSNVDPGWEQARQTLMQGGPDDLDTALSKLAPGWVPEALAGMPTRKPEQSLTEADVRDLSAMLTEWREWKVQNGRG